MFKVSLKSVGTFPILNNPVPRKRMVLERNGFGPRRYLFNIYRVLLKVKCQVHCEFIRCISNYMFKMFNLHFHFRFLSAKGILTSVLMTDTR